jgi:amino acid permease
MKKDGSDFFDSDKHLVTVILLIFLAAWLWTREDTMTRFMDTILGALIALVTQKLAKKE